MMEMVQRSIGVQVNLCNCHCLLGQSISSLPPRSPRTTTRSRHHFIFNKALSVDNSHPSETSSALRHKGVHDGSWESSGGQSANFHYSAITSGRGVGDYIGPGSGGPNCPCPYPHPHGSGQTVSSSVNNSTSSRTARSSLSEMDSVSEADENNKLLECSPASTSSTMEQEDLSSDNNILLGDQDRSSEASRLLPSTNSASGSNSNLNLSEHNQNQMMKSELSLHQTAADVLNKREQAHHFKRKYNFRSDSVFSDVMPLPAGADSPSRETPKNSDNRDKSGSLSSLKGQSSTSSKWASLRKKIGRLNSSSSEKKQHNALEQHAHLQHQLHQHEQQQQHKQHHPKSAKVSLDEKRSLLQRAKTLSILPVNKAGKEDIVKKPKEVPKQAPTELFNVGGEMNMIPLELLIDINDLNIGQ